MAMAQTAASSPAPMSYADILAFRRPQLVALSPDGGTIAYSLREARLEDNRNRDTVYLLDADGGTPKAGPVFDKMEQLAWDERGRLYLLGVKDSLSQVWRLDAQGRQEVVLSAASAIRIFAVAPDGGAFYYTTTRMTPPEEVRRRREEGFTYDWERQSARTIVNREYSENEWEDVWVAAEGQPGRLLHSIPYDGAIGVKLMHALVVSPTGRYLTMVVMRRGAPEKGGASYQSDLLILNLATRQIFNPFPDSIDIERAPCWLADHEVVFIRGHRVQTVWRYEATRQTLNHLAWAMLPERASINALACDQANRQVQAFGAQQLYRLSLKTSTVGAPETVQTGLGKTPALDARATKLALISESSTEPPEIGIYDLRRKTTARLTQLNPQLQHLTLGKVERLRIEASPGLAVTAFLLHPTGEEPGKRYPLIIATYGFFGKFITDAEWHSSFPAQTLAGLGYAVLMVNLPGGAQTLRGDAAKAQQIEGWNKVAIFEKAVDLLNERGLIDPDEVGLYGWSMGTFAVEFLLAHSKRFKVACVGEGGDYNPGMFWAYGSKGQTHLFENVFGGPPWGATLKNYESFSAYFNVEKIDAPLLMEFVGGLPFGLEMFVALRYRGVPAELVLYEGEEHNFVQPRARAASMERKVDWFNFWLLSKEDPNLSKVGQYARWRAMRSQARPMASATRNMHCCDS